MNSYAVLRGAVCSLFLLSFAVSAATTKSGGAYYYLATNGDDNNDGKSVNTPVKTFWHSQYLLAPGDTLLVRGGTYNDQLFVPLVDGTPAQPITVQAYPGEKPVIAGRSTWGAFVIITHSWWVFDGLTFDGLLDGNYVFWVHDAQHLIFRNLTIKKHAGDMILLASCEDVTIENSYFDTAGAPGDFGTGEHIWIAGSKRVLVQNNTLIRAGHASISIIDDNRFNDRWSSNNVIRNNVIEQHWGGGIYVGNYSRANLIENNRISYAGEQDPYTKLGMGISCPENIVRGNTITKTGSALQPLDNGLGMYAWDDGPKRQNAVDNRVYNNVVYKSANRGLYFFLRGESKATRNKFVNNVFYHNKEQTCEPWGCAEGLEISVDSFHTANKWTSFPNENYFFNNVILGANAGGNFPGGPVFLFDYQNWTKSISQLQADYPAYFKDNTDAAPQFVNADQGNFTLTGTSRLIDSGADLTRTVATGANTQSVRVEDARFFTDGYGFVAGDTIRVGSNGPVAITAIDYGSNTLTVARSISYLAGDPVNLPFYGKKPDVGAYEYGQSIAVAGGTPQTTNAGTQFAAPLQVKVSDGSAPVAGAVVTFSAPSSGASASFNGAGSATATTNASGIAASPVPLANSLGGVYSVSASIAGLSPAVFVLTNATVASPAPATEKTLYSTTAPPASFYADASSIELGVKFRSDVTGYVKGIRFYKNAGDTSQHAGSLWSSNGTLLGTGTFVNESAAGWQQLNFATPVAIAANATYVASYHTSSGFYYSWHYFENGGVDNAPLHALKNGADGLNGPYAPGPGARFPNQTFLSSNYWVDVAFAPNAALPQPQAVAAFAGTPQSATTGAAFAVAPQARVTDASSNPVAGVPVTFTAPGSGASATFDGAAAATVPTNASGIAIAPVPVANGVSGTYAVQAAVAGLAPATFALTNSAISTPPPTAGKTLFPASAVTGSFYPGPNGIELGVKFRSDANGYVTGIRFYQAAADTGRHTGSLWSANGKLLATGIFANETAAGWRQMNFATPVAVTANTTYVASYYTSSGFFYSWHYFQDKSWDNAPLHGLKDGADGSNGVYIYGPGGLFPNQTHLQSNYWVDLVFSM